jgi:transposase
LRYPSDVTEEEWIVIASLILPARRGGGKRTVHIREVFTGVLYIVSPGSQWRAIAKDLPPRRTRWEDWARWEAEGTRRRIQRECYGQGRE